MTDVLVVSTEYVHLSEAEEWQDEVCRRKLSSLIVVLESLVIVVLNTAICKHIKVKVK